MPRSIDLMTGLMIVRNRYFLFSAEVVMDFEDDYRQVDDPDLEEPYHLNDDPVFVAEREGRRQRGIDVTNMCVLPIYLSYGRREQYDRQHQSNRNQ